MLRIAARIAAALTAGVLMAAAAAHAAAPRLIGGQPVGAPSSAPFGVLIVAGEGASTSICTGSVIDANHVLTAAHCTRNEQGQQVPAVSMVVVVGTADAAGGLVGTVQGVRVHPAYDPATGMADVAVLQVPTIQMGSTIASVPLVGAGAGPTPGTSVRAYGFGDNGPDAAWDGLERLLDFTVGLPTDCRPGVAGIGCAQTATGGPCPGDSGGPLLRDGVQVGVTSTGSGLTCSAGSVLGFVDLSAPGIAQFVAGNDSPPPMPFTTAPATFTPPPPTGGGATCAAPAWTNAAGTTTVFFHPDGGAVVQDGPATTYTPKASDVGHQLSCRSLAQAAGGTATAPAATGVAVLAAKLAVRAARRSATVSYSGASGLKLVATLTNAKRRKVWSRSVTRPRVKLPKVRPGLYRLCVDAPAAGAFATVRACARWRAPKPKR